VCVCTEQGREGGVPLPPPRRRTGSRTAARSAVLMSSDTGR
jgi:hypothetical protein